ncbi:DUF998 domain-containing protein [Plantactinospora sp. S1510]|uniref:DUF998 domain-containing protein n=1 Tax=Plantactinospora alkalitolerans TaxID=2789879 RepID=A0ABS0GUV8_9ACTN|nr:DUF998 domain-containing protein [Plantactinospora alkalitolerans]MBF9129854.1 DUF998 domain-containing protein [Plantactinospora alkalitolerans]
MSWAQFNRETGVDDRSSRPAHRSTGWPDGAAEPRRGTAEPRRGTAALAAGVCTLAGGVAVILAVDAGPSPGFAGYVSEAGASTSPSVWTYRLGLLGIAAGLLLLAVALPPALRLAAGLLVPSGLATVMSAGVSCRSGCPLPPFDRTTLADLVHGGASIAAVAGTVFAVLAVALTPGAAPALRRLATVAAVFAVPLSLAAGVALLAVGRGLLTGTVERLLLLDLAAWGVATAIALGLLRPSATSGPGDPLRPDRADDPPTGPEM